MKLPGFAEGQREVNSDPMDEYALIVGHRKQEVILQEFSPSAD